ncbi:MAG: formyltransferase family protein [Rhodothalassiaceae bacterium]
MKPSILFIGKKGDFYCERAAEFVTTHFPEHEIVLGSRGDRFPEKVNSWRGDYIISYLSPWIVPASLLERAGCASINFHPGPPEYPGVGCTNFAIYDEADRFGVTCHHMAPKVDSGEIIAVRRFPLYESDSVYTFTQRCYGYILQLFYEMMSRILAGDPLPRADETWARAPYRRAELDALCRLTPDMPADEIRRRVRAVTFPGAPGAYFEIDGMRFAYVAEE